MRWTKGWVAAAGVFAVAAAVGGAAFAVAGSGSGSSPAQTGVAGKEVCAGQQLPVTTATGSPAVLSNQFPVGTTLRVTNLMNSRSITVPVAGTSNSCAVLNDAAFELLRSSDAPRSAENAVRRARVEIIGNAPAPTVASQPRTRFSGTVGPVVCESSEVGLSDVGGAPGAFSSLLPVGTTVRVTNLDNRRQATVKVVGVGAGCLTLNTTAFAQVGESGKSVIKRVQIEKVT